MIRSMTGFGDAQASTQEFAVRVEVRSVNNRNLRVAFRLPDSLLGSEPSLEKKVRGFVSRGTVTIAMTLDDLTGEPGYVVDEVAIRRYRQALQTLGEESGMEGEVPLSVLITLPGVVRKSKSAEEIPEDLRNAVCEALHAALTGLVASREQEGEAIRKDIESRCEYVGTLLDSVERRAPKMVEEYRKRLSERLQKLLAGVESSLPEDELCRQVALFADRSDISEEISRMRSHLALMKGAGSGLEASGRKLAFISQEMFREANTMASKANDAETIAAVLDIKAEIEKIREQAMNVE